MFCIVVVFYVGIGNFVGVVIVVVVGGLGVLFWMWIIVFLGVVISLIENILV